MSRYEREENVNGDYAHLMRKPSENEVRIAELEALVQKREATIEQLKELLERVTVGGKRFHVKLTEEEQAALELWTNVRKEDV